MLVNMNLLKESEGTEINEETVVRWIKEGLEFLSEPDNKDENWCFVTSGNRTVLITDYDGKYCHVAVCKIEREADVAIEDLLPGFNLQKTSGSSLYCQCNGTAKQVTIAGQDISVCSICKKEKE